MVFGQVVIGPPGSGKTTYCNGMSRFLSLIGRKLTKELCDVIEDYSLDKESVAKLVKLIDKSNGYIFAGMDASAVEFSKIAVRDVDWDYYRYPSF
ncbi:hypothetical protein CUMW_258780, partial [Citrus unshiu]